MSGLEALPRVDFAAVAQVLERAVHREVTRAGFTGVLLGLSGGLDSAVVAHLAVRSFGPENVLALWMPCGPSPGLDRARRVATDLGIEQVEEDIGAQIDAYFRGRPQASRLRRGNKMARERMTILYDYSMARQRLVLATSNKTELLLGYSTVFGDSAGAILPIGDLYKTQVRELGRHLGVSSEVIRATPSAELWPGQTDEAELGFSYDEGDLILHHLVDRRCSPRHLIEMGADAETVRVIQERLRRLHYKRKLPVIPKVSARTVDKDFLYARDWSS